MSLTEEQLAMRLTGVGGSEVAAVCGLNPFAGPFDVYRAKVEGHVIEDNEHMERGRFFERPTAEWYAHRNGATLQEAGTLRHPKHSIVLATPDFLASLAGGRRLDLSIKVPGPNAQRLWGEPGTDECPMPAFVQVQWELFILEALEGITEAVVAAPIFGELREFPVRADREFQGNLLEHVERFWADHIEPKKPPPIDGTAACSEWLRQRFEAHDGLILAADMETTLIASRLQAARLAQKKGAADEEEAKNLLIARMKDVGAEGMAGEGWKVSFRLAKGGVETDWKAVALACNAPEHIVQACTRIKQGSRRFVPTFSKESK